MRKIPLLTCALLKETFDELESFEKQQRLSGDAKELEDIFMRFEFLTHAWGCSTIGFGVYATPGDADVMNFVFSLLGQTLVRNGQQYGGDIVTNQLLARGKQENRTCAGIEIGTTQPLWKPFSSSSCRAPLLMLRVDTIQGEKGSPLRGSDSADRLKLQVQRHIGGVNFRRCSELSQRGGLDSGEGKPSWGASRHGVHRLVDDCILHGFPEVVDRPEMVVFFLMLLLPTIRRAARQIRLVPEPSGARCHLGPLNLPVSAACALTDPRWGDSNPRVRSRRAPFRGRPHLGQRVMIDVACGYHAKAWPVCAAVVWRCLALSPQLR